MGVDEAWIDGDPRVYSTKTGCRQISETPTCDWIAAIDIPKERFRR